MNVSSLLLADCTTIYKSGGNIAEMLRVLQGAIDVIHDIGEAPGSSECGPVLESQAVAVTRI